MIGDGWSLKLLERWQAWRLARRVRRFPELPDLSEEGLKARCRSLRHRVQRGQSWSRWLPEALALAGEAARRGEGRLLERRHLLAAVLIAEGAVVEMSPESEHRNVVWPAAFARALEQRGCHVMTVTAREAEVLGAWLAACAGRLGLSVGVFRAAEHSGLQQAALRCDITCGAAHEFGFAYLRDRMGRYAADAEPGTPNPNAPARWGGPTFAVALDADRLLIDEARTPLIVCPPAGETARLTALTHRWAAAYTARFAHGEDYVDDNPAQKIELTVAGCGLVRRLPSPEGLGQVALWRRYEAMEQALHARHRLARGRDYVVRLGRVLLVDSATGEVTESRKLRGGLHEALEAREGLDVSVQPGASIQITRGELCRVYPRLGGISVTAVESRAEFRELYRVPVVAVAGRDRAVQWLPSRAFPDETACRDAIVADVQAQRARGRAVLIAVRSGADIAPLSQLLQSAGVPHAVLDRNGGDADAVCVRAGAPGAVTLGKALDWLATSVAIDPAVTGAGGLHVIGAGLLDAARHDRKLSLLASGGTFQQFLSLDEDWLLRHFPKQYHRLLPTAQRAEGVPAPFIARLRRKLERRGRGERRRLHVFESQQRSTLGDLGPDHHLLWPV